MNSEDLKIILEKLKIDERLYSLNGDITKLGSLALNPNHGLWEIIGVGDRGTQTIDEQFDNEDEACVFLLKKLIDFKIIMAENSGGQKLNQRIDQDTPPDIIRL